MPSVELVYFEGCPNANQARENIKAAIDASQGPIQWTEWDLMAESTPESFRRFGSPTVLIDGSDVTGNAAENVAMACRTDGVPSIATITNGLRQALR